MLLQSGDTAAALAACSAATQASPAAVWAWRRLGFLRLATGEPEPAITAFQTALRGRPRHARTWEGLGAAYQALGRLTAALKVRALQPCQSRQQLAARRCARPAHIAPRQWGRAQVPEHQASVSFLARPHLRVLASSGIRAGAGAGPRARLLPRAVGRGAGGAGPACARCGQLRSRAGAGARPPARAAGRWAGAAVCRAASPSAGRARCECWVFDICGSC